VSALTATEEPRKVCVIGAGPSGVAMCRALKERGVPYDCFERSPAVGGLWRYPGVGGTGCAYECLFSNSSKEVMQFPTFPMPDDFPNYPHHTQVADYLDAYVDHFGLREDITFETEVESARPSGDGWDVQVNGETRRYRAVCVASGGRHAEPSYAEIEGEFSGRSLHAFDYVNAKDFEGKTVVVLGLGASAADIASEVSQLAERTYLAVRTGHWVVPKILLGHPIDQPSPLIGKLPIRARSQLLSIAMKIVHGKMSDHGLPDPPYRVGLGSPIVTTGLLPAITHGRVLPKPAIVRLDGDAIHFADGSQVQADALIYCTGYKIGFPMLDEDLISGGSDAPPLYNLAVPPEIPGLYFIGLLHSLLAHIPCAEAQAEWIGDVLTGDVELPPANEMWRTIRRDRRRMDRLFHDSSGHLLVDQHEFLRRLKRERRTRATGGRRGRAGGAGQTPRATTALVTAGSVETTGASARTHGDPPK
jgi:hypothetical protein